MNKPIPRILITPGEPAGVGPDIVLQIARYSFPAELIVVCDPDMLTARAKQLNMSVELLSCNLATPPKQHTPDTLKIIPVALATPCLPGQLNPVNSAYVMECLTLATDYCLQQKASALVTGPINKAAINMADIPFTGHTEFLAERCNAKHVLMLFVVDRLKVALATTHISLANVPKAITIPHLINTIELLHTELQHRFHIAKPKIFVSGLNPHAGEAGLLGNEEIDTIIPALNQLRAKQIDVHGPFPADTLFTKKHIAECNAILAMYHDQALPVVKYLGFSDAVNVTLGLPIIRTSVDHGTALDVAGTGKADAGSLNAAVKLAVGLSC